MRSKLLIMTLISVATLTVSARTPAQDLSQQIKESAFELVKNEMRVLVRLVEIDGRLAILKKWTSDARIVRETNRLLERGFTMEKSRSLARQNLVRDVTRIDDMYQELLDESAEQSKVSKESDFARSRIRGTNAKNRKERSIELVDLESEIKICVRDFATGDLHIRIESDTQSIQLVQSATQIQVIHIEDQKASVYRADNYEKLRAEQPGFVAMKLLRIWRAIGIDKPLSMASSEVVQHATKLLKARQNDEPTVISLLDQLENGSGEEKQIAESTLTKNAYKWSTLITQHHQVESSEQDFNFRVNDILKFSPHTKTQLYVNSFDWTDPSTLIQLWSHSPNENHPFLIDQLERVTGLSLGTTIQQWKAEFSSEAPIPARPEKVSVQQHVETSLIPKMATALRNTIQMTVDKGHVTFLENRDLKVKRKTPYQSEEEKYELAFAKFIADGFEKGIAERLAHQEVQENEWRGRDFGGQTEIGAAIEAIYEDVRKGRVQPGKFLVGQQKLRWPRNSKTFEFRFYDFAQEVSIELEINPGQSSAFTLITPDGFIDFKENLQQAKIAMLINGEPIVFHGENFAELVRDYPREFNRVIFPLWKQVGLSQPLSFAHPSVVSAALEKIEAQKEDEMEVFGQLERLNSPNELERNDAEEQLSKRFYKWKDHIDSLRKDIDFDEDANYRLNRIDAVSPGTDVQDYVNQFQLKNVDRLMLIWEYAPENAQQLIVGELESITGETFGNDIQAWKDGLAGSKRQNKD